MNEKTVLKSSIYVFLVGCLGLGLLSLLSKIKTSVSNIFCSFATRKDL